MKKSGGIQVLLLAFVVITGLSVLYWKDVGEKIVTASTSVNGREIPICSVETKEQKVVLSLEWSGDSQSLSQLLEILERTGAKAVFFITGEWVDKYPEEAVRILEAGQELGNGGNTHRKLTELSEKDCRREVMKLHTRVKKMTGYEMKVFRPPYGRYNDEALQAVYACGYYPVCWSIDSMDWKNYGVQDLVKRVSESEQLKNGAIINCKGNEQYLEAGLEEMIEAVQKQGYTFVTLSELIYPENYYMEMDGRQYKKRAAYNSPFSMSFT